MNRERERKQRRWIHCASAECVRSDYRVTFHHLMACRTNRWHIWNPKVFNKIHIFETIDYFRQINFKGINLDLSAVRAPTSQCPRLMTDSHEISHLNCNTFGNLRVCVYWQRSKTLSNMIWGFFFMVARNIVYHCLLPIYSTAAQHTASCHLSNVPCMYASLFTHTPNKRNNKNANGWKWCEIFNGFFIYFFSCVCVVCVNFGCDFVWTVDCCASSPRTFDRGNLVAWDLCLNNSRSMRRAIYVSRCVVRSWSLLEPTDLAGPNSK